MKPNCLSKFVQKIPKSYQNGLKDDLDVMNMRFSKAMAEEGVAAAAGALGVIN